MISQEEKAKLWEMIQDMKVAMMASYDGVRLRSRPMHVVQDSFDGKLWFFNPKHTHKSIEIDMKPQVNLSFQDSREDRYISLSGSAKLSQDPAKIEELWNPMASAWFPDGKRSQDVSLIEFDVQEAEYWDASGGKMKQLYAITKAKILHEKPKLGENEKYS